VTQYWSRFGAWGKKTKRDVGPKGWEERGAYPMRKANKQHEDEEGDSGRKESGPPRWGKFGPKTKKQKKWGSKREKKKEGGEVGLDPPKPNLCVRDYARG